MKKILQVNKFFPPVLGGVEVVVEQYSGILSRDFRVQNLVASKRCSTEVEKTSDGAEVIRCSSFGTVLSTPLSLSFFWHFIKRVSKSDVIIFHEPFPLGTLAALIACFSDAKIVIVWHSDIVKQKFFGMIFKPLQSLVLNRADKILATSDQLLKSSRKLSAFKDKCEVIPLWLSDGKARSFEKPAEVERDRRYVLFLGRFSYYKGLAVLEKALKKVDQDVFVVIAGSGDIESSTDSAFLDSRKTLLLNREITEDEKNWLLENCEFLVFPSVAKSEAFGIVQLEAMRCGKPVINTNLATGVPWVSLDGVSGLTVEVGDSCELAKAMDKLWSDSLLVSRLGEGASSRVKALFSESICGSLLTKAIKDLS